MGFDVHTIGMPVAPYLFDRLVIGSMVNVAYPAAAAALGTTGAVTAGSGYTFTPVVTPTGGTVTAASGPGVTPIVAAGWAAVIRATMKVVGTPAVVAGGTGYVTNDTVLFANGVKLTVTASAGVVTSLALTTAGNIAQPGGMPVGAQSPLSTSGVGTGLTCTFSWGIDTALVDDSGNYSVIPTGFTVTSVDGNGTSGAVAAGAATSAGNPVFRQVSFGPPGPVVGAAVSASPATLSALNHSVNIASKIHGFVNFRVQPMAAANSVTAGTFDALAWA